MGDDRLAIVVLAGTTLAALIGAGLLITSSMRRAALVERGRSGDARDDALSGARGVLDSAFRKSRLGRALAVRLANAGVERTPFEFAVFALGIAVAGFILARILLPPIAAFLVAAGCLAGVWNWLDRQREARRRAFIAQLPEVARLLSNSAAAGLSMVRAVEIAGRELEEPAGSEISRLAQQQRLGQSIDEALEGLKERMPSREVSVLMGTLIIQQRAGGDVVKALRDIAATLDARKDLLREVRTVMAGAVFTSYLVAGMGIGTIFMIDLISPGVVDEMLTSGVGLAAFAVAGLLYATGFLLIRRITRVET